jgi:hypothetical protein
LNERRHALAANWPESRLKTSPSRVSVDSALVRLRSPTPAPSPFQPPALAMERGRNCQVFAIEKTRLDPSSRNPSWRSTISSRLVGEADIFRRYNPGMTCLNLLRPLITSLSAGTVVARSEAGNLVLRSLIFPPTCTQRDDFATLNHVPLWNMISGVNFLAISWNHYW